MPNNSVPPPTSWAKPVAFIVHEFRSVSLSELALERSAGDLAAFAERLVGESAAVREGRLSRPFHLPGSDWDPSSMALFIGQAVAELQPVIPAISGCSLNRSTPD